MDFVGLVAALGALSLTVTKIVDFFRNVLDKQDMWPKWVWNVVALVIGLVLCVGWQINLAGAASSLVPALADKASVLAGVSGQILTGVVVGMASGFWHELLDALSSVANRNNSGLTE